MLSVAAGVVIYPQCGGSLSVAANTQPGIYAIRAHNSAVRERSLEKADHYHAADRAAWRAWLKRNHATSHGVWLVYDKAAEGKKQLLWYVASAKHSETRQKRIARVVNAAAQNKTG